MDEKATIFLARFDDGIARILRGLPAFFAGNLALSIGWTILRPGISGRDLLMGIRADWICYISLPSGVIFLAGGVLNLYGALVCFADAFAGVASRRWARCGTAIAALSILAAGFGSFLVTRGSVDTIVSMMAR